ncbi:MAG: class I SAM-dependent methyltransferase [Polaromonas sp.]|uniref:class I SAM-dependent methyltransferase n=1 Tax=Polaromonas sp. TaxID=1869339 RepID=UPI0032676C96
MTADNLHGTEPPSAWVQRWSHLVPARGAVLDVACGYGRHARWFYERNHPVALVDRAQAAIEFIANSLPAQGVEAVVADIEEGPWPFAGRQFDAVVVTNYLWRPLLPTLLASLAPGAVLIYETFTQGNETVGKPSRPDFLLRPGELLEVCRGLRVVAFEEGFEERSPRFVQRIAAVRETALSAGLSAPAAVAAEGPPRYRLA